MVVDFLTDKYKIKLPDAIIAATSIYFVRRVMH